MKGTPQLDTILSGWQSKHARVLSEAYLRSTQDLLPQVEAGPERWRMACEVALLRRRLRHEFRVDPCDLWLYEHDGSNGGARRLHELLKGVIGHFRSPELSKLVDQLRDGHLTEGAFADRLCRSLTAPCRWTSSLDRLRATHLRTTQEDLLLHELVGRVRRRDSSALSTAISAIRHARAIDNAQACLQLVNPILAVSAPQGRRFLSIGAGVGAFEHLLSVAWSVAVTAIDTTSPAFPIAHAQVEYVVSDCIVALTTISPGSISVLIAKDVLHELRDPETVLQLAAKVCEPDGLLLVIEPSYRRADSRSLQALIELDSTAYPSSFRATEEWREALTGAGFQIEHHLEVAPGVIDNNDMFPRTLIVARRSA